MSEKVLTVLSLGAGVQSSTLALMAAHGEVGPMPDAAIFADTLAEPRSVYKHLWLLKNRLPFPVYMVSAGNLETAITEPNRGFMPVPFRLRRPDGTEAVGRRQCTREYKIAPINKKLRELCGGGPFKRADGYRVNLWKGISWDERQRMDEDREHWIKARFPLIEKQMTRGHCLEWMEAHGYPQPPRSACIFCPYLSNEEWRAMDPADFADACRVDRAIRDNTRDDKGEMFVHRSLVPLEDADLTTPESAGQISLLDECDGMCGL